MKKYVIKRDRSGLPEKLTRFRQELNDEQLSEGTQKIFKKNYKKV